MSKDNPFDDEEAFTEQILENSIPPDEDVIRNAEDKDVVLKDIIKRVTEHFNHKHITEITLGFEFRDEGGYYSWINVHYMRKD